MYSLMAAESVTVASADITPVVRTLSIPSSVKPNIDLNNKRPSVKASTSPLASTSKMDMFSALSS